MQRVPDDMEVKTAHYATQSILRWFHLQEISPRRFLSQLEANAIFEAGCSYLRLYESLARAALARRLYRWKVLPKFHVSCQYLLWFLQSVGSTNIIYWVLDTDQGKPMRYPIA